jgi:hypothetical protein
VPCCASSLTIYFNTQYRLDAKMSGFFTAACVFAGSMVRPIGGIKSLSLMYLVAAIFLSIVSIGLPQAWMALLVFIRVGEPMAPTRYRPDIPGWLENVLLKAVSNKSMWRQPPATPLARRNPLLTWRIVAALSLVLNLVFLMSLLR